MTSKERINYQFRGYQKTPNLWSSDVIFGLEQLKISSHNALIPDRSFTEKLRLGNRVERFVSSDLKQMDSITILAENIQIKKNKITLGELDCLMFSDEIPIHLEVVFKFYLYDPSSVGNNHLNHWIGANRNDSLIQKLEKLKRRQFPLLYHEQTRALLENLNLISTDIQQKVLFKAQLFTPFGADLKDLFKQSELNMACLRGFYIRPVDLQQFEDCQFYIPSKTDWLMDVQRDVTWLEFTKFQKYVKIFVENHRSPLCWIQFPDGKLEKFFVVCWE